MPRIYASSLQGNSQRVLSEAAIQRQALHRGNVHILQTHPYTHSPSYSQYASSRATSREVAVNQVPTIQHDKKNSGGGGVHNHPSKTKRRSSPPVNPNTDMLLTLCFMFHIPCFHFYVYIILIERFPHVCFGERLVRILECGRSCRD